MFGLGLRGFPGFRIVVLVFRVRGLWGSGVGSGLRVNQMIGEG